MSQLTNKQRLFVECYLANGLNATDAARKAGYQAKDDNAFAVIGYENLRKLKIRELIETRLDEAVLSANEVLYRLSLQARGSMQMFVSEDLDGSIRLDLPKAYTNGKFYLVKKFKETTTRRIGSDEAELIDRKVEIELYDAHAALVDLGKYRSLFTEKVEHSGEVGMYPVSLSEWKKQRSERAKLAQETWTQFEDEKDA